MIRSAFVRCAADHGVALDRLRMTMVRARISTTRAVSTLSSGNHSLFGGLSSGLGGWNHSNNQSYRFPVPKQQQQRWYTPMTKEEEEIEKARVSHLLPDEKETELRSLNREIAKLETLRGINTGELYTWSGRYKSLLKNYGFPLLVYYWTLWATMGGIVYLGIDFGGVDAMALLQKIDANTGWSVSDKVDPQLGKMGVALILNECLEPIRMPFVVVTLKPVMDIVSPPKY